jgi:RND superfamily putative drug exporter
VWLGSVVIAMVAGHFTGTVQLAAADTGAGQTGVAQQMIARDFTQRASETVLFESPASATSPAFRTAVADTIARVQATGRVTSLQSPYDPRYSGALSAHAALLSFQLTGSLTAETSNVAPVLDAVSAAARAHPGITIAETGDATITKALDDTVLRDLHRAELLSFPVTLVVLLIAFAALVAALLPLGLATLAILAATGLVAFTSHLSGVSTQASSVMLLIGLAVGVDYSMFYVKRAREERAAGKSALDAITTAAATSGRSVLISGLIVLLAMSGMFILGNKVFTGIGQSSMLVVAVAIIGSLTLLPALLSLLGDRVDAGTLHALAGARRPPAENRVWGAILRRTLARPALSAVAAAAVLGVLAIPAFSLHTAEPGASDLPQATSALQTYNRIQRVFPGDRAPAQVVIEVPAATSPAVLAAGAAFEKAALATGEMFQPITITANAARTAAIINVPLAGNGEDAASAAALATLRTNVIPATLGALPGAKVAVGGLTAATVDFNALMGQRLPWVFAFVLLLDFVLLLISFRSLAIPVTAVVLNLLSVGAAYGVIVAIFQWGWGQSLLGFTSPGAIASYLPPFFFVLLFGLSMDYHVFILSRIRESYDRTGSTNEAVAHGIKTTAGVVTAAAVVMVFVFGTFATLSMVSLKEMGVGLAVAVLLDATVVRAVLLPATMTLLGQRNWYLPRWLAWLPQVSDDDALPTSRSRAPRVAEPDPAGVAGLERAAGGQAMAVHDHEDPAAHRVPDPS